MLYFQTPEFLELMRCLMPLQGAKIITLKYGVISKEGIGNDV
jgi:hypothetical protein